MDSLNTCGKRTQRATPNVKKELKISERNSHHLQNFMHKKCKSMKLYGPLSVGTFFQNTGETVTQSKIFISNYANTHHHSAKYNVYL